MFKLFVVLFVFVLICLEQVNSQIKPKTKPFLTKEELEAISTFADLGTAYTKAAVLQDVNSVVEVIGKLGKAIPYLGPISTTISGLTGLFIHHPDELAGIKKKLIEMDSHLFAIENKIDAIVQQIVEVAENMHYRERAEKISNLQDAYQRFIGTPTVITKQDMIYKCKTNEHLDYINYVYRDLLEGAQPLMKLIKNEYDMRKFHSWTRLLVSSVSQTMFLHSVCIGLQHPNTTDRQKTMAGDITHFQSITVGLEKVTRDGINDIKDNFFEAMAKNEIRAYAQSHQSESNEDFAKHVYDMLSAKYYWRYWFVGSYSKHTGGFDQHCVASGKWVYFWFRNFGRSAYISSTNNPENFKAKLQNCIDLHHADLQAKSSNGRILTDLYEKVSTCLGSTNGFGVVKFGNGLRASLQGIQSPFINVAIQLKNSKCNRHGLCTDERKDFSVFAIASELNH